MKVYKILVAVAVLMLPATLPAKEVRWEPSMKKFEAQDAVTSPPRHAILFVGSSSIVKWNLKKFFPGMPVINRGFGGSQVSDVLDYYDKVVTPYNPDTIVFYSGDNDLAGGKTTATVAADVHSFVKRVHRDLPQTKIIILPPKPSPSRWKLWPKFQEVAQAEKQLDSADDKLEFLNTGTAILGADGKPRQELFEKDKLHMNDEGYKIWSDMLRPLLKDDSGSAAAEHTSPRLQAR